MNRRPAWIYGGLVFLMILYFGYESLFLDISTSGEFLESYLNNIQKYMFNGTIYGIPFIYLFSVRFRAPEYAVRIRQGKIWFLTIKCIRDSLLLSVFVLLLHCVSAVVFRLTWNPGLEFVEIYVRLAIYYAFCSFWYYLIYATGKSLIVAIGATVGVNWLFLSAVLVYNFVMCPLDDITTTIFVVYEIAGCIISYIGLCMVVRKQECLS